jgi:hypothetical protein
MRVRFVGSRSTSGERRESHSLTVGAEYVVLSIVVSPGEGVLFRILDDASPSPALHASAEFDLVSDRVPSNWRIAVGAGGSPAALDRIPMGYQSSCISTSLVGHAVSSSKTRWSWSSPSLAVGKRLP